MKLESKPNMASTHAQHMYSTPTSDEDETAAFVHAGQLASAYAIPMTLKAVIEIGVLEIIDDAGPGCQLSAAEISARTSTANPQGSAVLDRMLKYLASHSVLTCSVVEGERGRLERRYGLAPVCKFFVDRGDGATVAPLVLMNQDKVLQDSWQELKCAFLDGVIPFQKAHGMNAFEYHGTDQRFNRVFNNGMSCTSTLLLKKMLDSYTGFRGIGKLVDVGGGIGSALRMIVSKFPHVKGVNFDLPHVVSEAPLIPGVEHIGGDMFVGIPTADAIFMKWILHDWSDEHCLKILKNCLEALADNGKVIIVEAIIPETPETDAATQLKLHGDLCMLTYNIGGKERTEKEFEFLAREAGFSEFKVVSPIYCFSVMELLK